MLIHLYYGSSLIPVLFSLYHLSLRSDTTSLDWVATKFILSFKDWLKLFPNMGQQLLTETPITTRHTSCVLVPARHLTNAMPNMAITCIQTMQISYGLETNHMFLMHPVQTVWP